MTRSDYNELLHIQRVDKAVKGLLDAGARFSQATRRYEWPEPPQPMLIAQRRFPFTVITLTPP